MNRTATIKNGWAQKTLGEIMDVKHGFAFSGEFITDVENENILLTPGNFEIGGGWKYGKKFFTGDVPKNYLLMSGDLVVTMTDLSKTGDTLGYPALIPDNPSKKFLHNQRIGLVTLKEAADKRFIYYLMRWRAYQKYIVNSSTGSTVRHTSPTKILSFELSLPPLPEQRAIAAVLTPLDDKIDLIQEQNNTLEEITKEIFEQWFGGHSVDDPDELPEGWKVMQLGNLLSLVIDYRGKTPKKLGMSWSETGISALSAKTIKNGRIVRKDAMNYGSKDLYSKWMQDELMQGDILLTSEAPLGELYYLNSDKKYILSQRLFALRASKKLRSEYLYHYLYSRSGQALIQARATGSTVAGIRQPELRKVQVVVPDEITLNKTADVFKAIFDKMTANQEQVELLSNLRDYLIPKLMSGEFRIEDITK